MKTYPDNSLPAFTVQLTLEIDQGTDRCEVWLCEFSCPPPNVDTLKPNVVVGKTNALIYYNLKSPQFVGEYKLKCLRTYIHSSTFSNHVLQNVYYIPVEKQRFQNIRIVIADLVGDRIPYNENKAPVGVVLHIRRVFEWWYAYI
jgi:hypothetical protein